MRSRRNLWTGVGRRHGHVDSDSDSSPGSKCERREVHLMHLTRIVGLVDGRCESNT